MRIYEIIFSFDVEAAGGGITRFATALCQAMDSKNFEMVVCGLWDRGTEREQEHIRNLRAAGLTAFTCAGWNENQPYQAFYQAYLGLRATLSQRAAEIVHSHSQFGDVVALLLKIQHQAPLIVRTVHNGFRKEWKGKPLRRLLLSKLLYPLYFDAEIGVSQQITDQLTRRWLAKQQGHPGLMINNALDLRRFAGNQAERERIRDELGIPGSAYVIGTVGRLSEEKGYDVLLSAATQIAFQDDQIIILIVGEGASLDSLKRQAIDAGIAEKVIFTGGRLDVEALLTAMDVFVCSSRWEGLSTAIMEAMASGLPVVATDIPGNRELLRAEENAWLVPVNDANALAASLLIAKHNPDTALKFASQARKDVQALRIELVAQKHAQLYQELYDKQKSK